MITITELEALRRRENERHAEALHALSVVEEMVQTATPLPPVATAKSGFSPSRPYRKGDIIKTPDGEVQITAASHKVSRVMKALQQSENAPKRHCSRAGSGELQKRILDALSERGEASPKALASAVGESVVLVKYHLKQLLAANQLTASGNRRSRVYRVASPPPRQPLTPPGVFPTPRPAPSKLEQAVQNAFQFLPEKWTREQLETHLSNEMRNLGRENGNLAAVLVSLRERGVIELIERGAGGCLYRTGQPAK